MHDTYPKIKAAIIDDDEEFIFSLKESLFFFSDIEVVECASKYKQARNIIYSSDFELLFLDIEMPVKNGFELLQESKKAGRANFSVIFHTAYDKYMIQALRESAFDFILKPIKIEELRSAIDRFKAQRSIKSKPLARAASLFPAEITSLPTVTGIRFVEKNSILLFQWNCNGNLEKKHWSALLTDRSQVKLKSGKTAKDILDFMGNNTFIRISPTVIINVNYLAAIEYATRECLLLPPFNDIRIAVSRSNLAEIRDKFDLL